MAFSLLRYTSAEEMKCMEVDVHSNNHWPFRSVYVLYWLMRKVFGCLDGRLSSPATSLFQLFCSGHVTYTRLRSVFCGNSLWTLKRATGLIHEVYVQARNDKNELILSAELLFNRQIFLTCQSSKSKGVTDRSPRPACLMLFHDGSLWHQPWLVWYHSNITVLF